MFKGMIEREGYSTVLNYREKGDIIKWEVGG